MQLENHTRSRLEWRLRACVLAAAVVAALCLAACAAGPRTAFHAFSFDARFDGWLEDTDLLIYNYGSEYSMVRKDLNDPNYALHYLNLSTLRQQGTVTGEFPVGDFLEVKWRVRSTGKIYHEKVDLRPLLPRDMDDCTVTFVIDGPQLYIYLVTAQHRPDDSPLTHKTALSQFDVTYELFPRNELANHQ